MDVTVKEDHLGKNVDEHVCALLGAAKLFVQLLNFINFYSFDVLHENCSLGALQDIDTRNVEIVTVAHVAEVVNCLLRIDHLSLEI